MMKTWNTLTIESGFHGGTIDSELLFIENGDSIVIDARSTERKINVLVSDEEMAKRKAKWVQPELPVKRGTLYKYIKNVESASLGCVTDE